MAGSLQYSSLPSDILYTAIPPLLRRSVPVKEVLDSRSTAAIPGRITHRKPIRRSDKVIVFYIHIDADIRGTNTYVRNLQLYKPFIGFWQPRKAGLNKHTGKSCVHKDTSLEMIESK